MDLYEEIEPEIKEIFGHRIDPRLVINRNMYQLYELASDDKEYILRIIHPNQKDEIQSKIVNESVVLDKVKKNSDVPVPNVYHTSTSTTESPVSYIVLEKMQGTPLKDAWHLLSSEERIHISTRIAIALKQLHEIELPFYGKLGGSDSSTDWSDFFERKFEDNISYLRDNDALDHSLLGQAEIFFNRHRAALSNTTTPRLIHNDLNGNNILVDKSEEHNAYTISLIDWEWAMGAIPHYDLVKIDSLFHNVPSIIENFNEKYGYDYQSGKTWDNERRIYLLQNFLESACYYKKGNNFDTQKCRLSEFMIRTVIRKSYS